MSDVILEITPNQEFTENLVKQCRYCLEEGDLISPCKCTGSSEFVHQKCLILWLKKRQEQKIMPVRSEQFDLGCEICKYKYKIKAISNTGISAKRKLYWEVAKGIISITFVLACLYAGVGATLESSPVSSELFVSFESYWENVFANGFILVSLVVMIIYMIRSVTSPSCYCFLYIPFEEVRCEDEGGIVCLVVFCALSIVLIVYFDIIGKIIQRHKNTQLTILEISNYKA